MEPPTHEIAYKALSQIVDKLHQDFEGQTVLWKRQDLLTQDDEFDLNCSERVNQVYRLMKQLNNLRNVCAIRESEHIITNPLDVAGRMKASGTQQWCRAPARSRRLPCILKAFRSSTDVQCSQVCSCDPMLTR